MIWLKKAEHYKNLLKIKYQARFWSCKFISDSNLNKKVESYKLKKIIKNLKVHIKMDKKIIKFGDNEIEVHKSHQYKGHILI